MCGINGFSWEDVGLITEMNQITKNRGPDDQGVYCDSSFSLGHSRLSIIDLSDNGHQPMSNEDQSIWIVFNGEIYNFQTLRTDLIEKGHLFKSNTDTEVIVHAYEEYGLDCVKKFNGMWAFSIYDKRDNTIILGRDQFGIKPLYYHIDDRGIIFSSMISAILCHKLSISPHERAIMEYLAHNLEDHKNYTFFTNIEKIPQDSLLIYDLSKKQFRVHKWYYPAKREDVDTRTIQESFVESIRLRTIADVPIGSCLSGGIDSSTIVSTLNTILTDKFNTFSLVVPGFFLDESKYIIEVGKKTNVQQFFTQLSEKEFLLEFEDFVRAQEEPVTGLSPYAQYCVMKLAHQHKAKVLLDGQGGDEIFAGYNYYFAYYFYELLIGGKFLTLGREMRKYQNNFKDLYPQKMFVFLLLPEFLKYHIWKSFTASWINKEYLLEKCDGEMDPRWRRMTLPESLSLTLYSTAIPHLLRWEDKNSMRWSIESRPPFLDVNLVEAAMSLRSDKKIANGRTKVIFLEAVKDCLPPMVRDRKDKVGFATPTDDFFRKKQIVDFCRDIIYSDKFKSRPYWNWKEIERLYNLHLQRKINIGDTIWKWINLETWLREFFNETDQNPGVLISNGSTDEHYEASTVQSSGRAQISVCGFSLWRPRKDL
ncbi:asparagine synthase (glutamine-hydrolyzing) [Methanosphaerula subterraneus]|uniref:asparagine synthase (glutamine-hydrolyzing) n=1 Tax=Methanosphaerula subterraneus TaxID=3350244 RepID=UPI003F84C950